MGRNYELYLVSTYRYVNAQPLERQDNSSQSEQTFESLFHFPDKETKTISFEIELFRPLLTETYRRRFFEEMSAEPVPLNRKFTGQSTVHFEIPKNYQESDRAIIIDKTRVALNGIIRAQSKRFAKQSNP